MIGLIAAVVAGGLVALAPRPGWGQLTTSGAAALLGLGVVVLLTAIGVSGAPWPLFGFLVAGAWAGQREVRRRRWTRDQKRRGAAAMLVCEGLSANLRAGLPPIAALGAAAREWPEFRPVADAGHLGGDVPGALRALASRPGAAPLSSIAAAWVVAHRSGAGLAEAVEMAATMIREERSTSRVVATELAAARATAKLLVVLPLGVLLAGRGAGGDPFQFLLGTTPGIVCLAIGLTLLWVGSTWLERIASSVLS